ncbi:pyridoxine 5'-phosphate synthase [Rhodocaloribacter litoris]|uniref:pyridoxine 5'-phosphate synthase n=1 Tax=Rhodocaloribacter litoris TaxID=2558931 RepID=UPI001423D73D|nr:pyridoxine 5'-phosphate synthase [Rhodocaloribacter litoris]QXD14564.1 pyridoxine 5'-phosphate synthase [Rhodocaloribacter litoris]
MIDLLINIDHIATLRNARRETFPDPVHAAALCEAAGADGIVFHLREDRRHITDRDVRLLRETVQGKLDFELSTNPEVVEICCATQPDLATLVPERREEVTTEGGLDVLAERPRLRALIPRLYDAGIPEVALFVDPNPDQVEAAREVGANAIELHTGDYANAPTFEDRRAEAERLAAAAERAHALGLRIHAGHGLNYNNFGLFKRTVPHVAEVSIGFAVVARAVLVGLDRAVREMRRVVKGY